MQSNPPTPTAPGETPPPETESSRLTPVQKVAALLVVLGPEGAARILNRFDEKEVELISTEMAKMKLVSADLQTALLREFAEAAGQTGAAHRGGVEYTQAVLERAVGPAKASHLLSRIAPARPVPALQQIVEAEASQTFNL